MRAIVGFFSAGLVMGVVMTGCPVKAATFPGENGTIAFTKSEKRQSGIWTIELGQSVPRLWAKKDAKNPVWSPDGTKVAFERDDRLYIANANGRDVNEIAHQRGYAEMSPVWTADGSKLAFVRERSGRHGEMGRYRDQFSAVFSVRVNGKNVTNISGWSKERAYTSPSWSPTGDRIAYVSYNEEEAKLLKKELLSSGSAATITTLSDPINATVAWSPSSEKILYQDSKNEIYTIWSDGTRRAVISDGDSYDASWSPDGTQIVFVEDPNDRSISIRETDGTVVQIPIEKDQYASIGDPTWSPDATKVLVTMSGGTKKDRDVYMVDIGGRTAALTKVIDNSDRKVSWQARR